MEAPELGSDREAALGDKTMERPERTTSSSVERTDLKDEGALPPSPLTNTTPIRRRNEPTTRWRERTPPATKTTGSGNIRPIANESRKLT